MPNQTPTVEKLPSNILNYYAAFTETKFNFKTLINYRWTNNELTLDLSLFQNFQEHLLQRLKSGDATPPPLSVHGNEYTLSLPGADVGIEIEKALSAVLNLNYLQNCIAQEGKFIKKINNHVRTITDEGNDLLTPADYFGWFDRLKKGVF